MQTKKQNSGRIMIEGRTTRGVKIIMWHLWGWVLDVTAWWCWNKVFLVKIFKIDLLREDKVILISLHIFNGIMSGRPL